MGDYVSGYHAHHVFPQEFRGNFAEPPIGINVDDPAYGVWLEIFHHQEVSKTYNSRWRRFLDPSKWDGSDFFWVGNAMVVVERVREIFEKHRVTNVCFTHLSDVEILSSLVAVIKRKQAPE